MGDLKLFNCVPEGVNEVHFAADSCLLNSIKATECKTHKKVLESCNQINRIPADFQSFLKNVYSKISIFDLCLDYTRNHKTRVPDILRCIKIYCSKYNYCESISYHPVTMPSISVASKKNQIGEFFVTVNTFSLYKKMDTLLLCHH